MADEPFALADRVAACLLSLTPSAVHRANRRLTQSHNFLTYEDDLRTLLVFHQDVVSPISSTFAYALPSSKALRAIVKHAPSSIIEIGAGGGLWASLLRRCGVQVDAIDVSPPRLTYCNVRQCSDAWLPQTFRKAKAGAALFLCWPPLELELGEYGEIKNDSNTMASDALNVFHGDVLIYIGEWRGRTGLISQLSDRTADCGQTAGENFQEWVERDWYVVETVELPRWPGFADSLVIFRSKHPKGASSPSSSAEPAPAVQPPLASTASSLSERLRSMADVGLTQSGAIAAAILLDQSVR